MAKIARKQELIETSFAFQTFGKRYADLTPDELRKYNSMRQNYVRNKDREAFRKKNREYKRLVKQRRREMIQNARNGK